jgi:hypothetical protein
MSYIGAQPTTASFPFDQFSGNGSTTAFTMSYAPAGTTSIIVSISGVVQNPNTYTVSGVTLTFSPAPPTGTNNIGVLYLGLPAIAGGGASTPAAVSDQANTSTGYFSLPAGTTAQRPVSPQNGATRYNTTTGSLEWYDGTNWYSEGGIYNVTALIIAGGGGGAGANGNNVSSGGGGAGGLISTTTTLTAGVTYSFVIGAGGAGGAGTVSSTAVGASGVNTTALGQTAIGGGGGGSYMASPTSGGSGGGAGSFFNTSYQTPGSGTSGQGFAGGTGILTVNSTAQSGGGGGGYSSAGGNAVTSTGGNGGSGFTSSITGTSTVYAGGGGGGAGITVGTGQGGGGNGSVNAAGNPALANTGGGGGGANNVTNGTARLGGNGGSGVVILSIPTVNYTGNITGSPTVTTDGSNTVVKFTTSGSYIA